MPLNNPATAGPTHQSEVTASRALNTIYRNTTGVTLYVAATFLCYVANTSERARATSYTDPENPPTTSINWAGYANATPPESLINDSLFLVVLPGNYYKIDRDVSGVGTVTLVRWIEWY